MGDRRLQHIQEGTASQIGANHPQDSHITLKQQSAHS